MDAIEANMPEAARFLAALSLDTWHTFQTFDDDEERKKAKAQLPGLARIVRGRFASKAAALEHFNAKGAGVFVMVNAGDGKGRKGENVKAVRALWVDLDSAPLEPVLAAPIPPAIVCETSPGKFHAYWPIAGMPLADFRGAQQELARRYGSDPKVCDLSRVMRLPGFWHRKGKEGARPFQSRLVTCETVKPWPWADFAQAMGLEHVEPVARERIKLPKAIPEGERSGMLLKLATAAHRKGIAEAEEHSRLLSLNAERCKPPLADSEVLDIVSRAYAQPSTGYLAIPYRVIDSPEYRAMTAPERDIVTLAYRRFDGYNNGQIKLSWSECEASFDGKKKKFYSARKAVVSKSGIVVEAIPAGKPSKGKQATSARYRLPFIVEGRGTHAPRGSGSSDHL